MGATVEQTAADILLQAHGEGYRAALFAMGLMPALIALGAKLGNKCDITPMLRYRENGLWYWPMTEPQGEFYTIDGLDQLSGEDEVCLLIGLTAVPETMLSTADSLGIRVVSVVARTKVPLQRCPWPSGRWRGVPAANAGTATPVAGRARCTDRPCAAVRVQRCLCILRASIRQPSPGLGNLRLRVRRNRHDPEIESCKREQRVQGGGGSGCTIDPVPNSANRFPALLE